MREGPAVDDSGLLAVGDAEAEDGDHCDHMQRYHQCMREETAVDASGQLAAGDAEMEDGDRCDRMQCLLTGNCTVGACEKSQLWIAGPQWMAALVLL